MEPLRKRVRLVVDARAANRFHTVMRSWPTKSEEGRSSTMDGPGIPEELEERKKEPEEKQQSAVVSVAEELEERVRPKPNRTRAKCRNCTGRPGFRHICPWCGMWFCPQCLDRRRHWCKGRRGEPEAKGASPIPWSSDNRGPGGDVPMPEGDGPSRPTVGAQVSTASSQALGLVEALQLFNTVDVDIVDHHTTMFEYLKGFELVDVCVMMEPRQVFEKGLTIRTYKKALTRLTELSSGIPQDVLVEEMADCAAEVWVIESSSRTTWMTGPTPWMTGGTVNSYTGSAGVDPTGVDPTAEHRRLNPGPCDEGYSSGSDDEERSREDRLNNTFTLMKDAFRGMGNNIESPHLPSHAESGDHSQSGNRPHPLRGEQGASVDTDEDYREEEEETRRAGGDAGRLEGAEGDRGHAEGGVWIRVPRELSPDLQVGFGLLADFLDPREELSRGGGGEAGGRARQFEVSTRFAPEEQQAGISALEDFLVNEFLHRHRLIPPPPTRPAPPPPSRAALPPRLWLDGKPAGWEE